jgi:hypothetical protein
MLVLEPEAGDKLVLDAAANMDVAVGLAADCGGSDENDSDGFTFSFPNARACPGTLLLASLALDGEEWLSSFCTLAAPSDGAMMFWDEA